MRQGIIHRRYEHNAIDSRSIELRDHLREIEQTRIEVGVAINHHDEILDALGGSRLAIGRARSIRTAEEVVEHQDFALIRMRIVRSVVGAILGWIEVGSGLCRIATFFIAGGIVFAVQRLRGSARARTHKEAGGDDS
jgi:hypothetical protein